MIRLDAIEVRGQSNAGPFEGTIALSPGLQVVSARNAYGKSLAVTAVAWCLGIEAIFGNKDNDPSRFPEAVRDELELPGSPPARVLSSECSITLEHEDGRRLQLTRAIKGDSSFVHVEESLSGENIRKSKLFARQKTMQDEHGGLQRFLFGWLEWPRVPVATFGETNAEVYLENLAPAFYIDQNEGWTNVQALQIGRYRQLQIAEVTVEYLLGAIDALRARVARQNADQKSAVLRETARAIAERVGALLLRRGWRVDWSGHGSLDDVLARWSSRTLREVLKRDADVDLSAQRASLNEQIDRLRQTLTIEPIDPANASAPAAASQRVLDLKQQRHKLSADLHTFRTQSEQAKGLLASLEHRVQAARDLLRLKTIGVGRLDRIECPTCHRDLEPETFELTAQSMESISAHIEALQRDRQLMSKNLQSLQANLTSTGSALSEVSSELRDAQSALTTVTAAVGTVREQIAKTAADLTSAERAVDRIVDLSKEIDDLQQEINKWIADAGKTAPGGVAPADLQHRRDEFLNALRKYLAALGHSAVKPDNQALLVLDEQYVPYLSNRRLRSLGSASDQCRLVAAYTLALAAASREIGGLHPGVVILDEPLQQNPDPQHRELFLSFLSQELARQAEFQTVIFTSLRDDEIDRLRGQGTSVLTPEGEHFLKLTEASSDTEGNRKFEEFEEQSP